MTKEKNYKIKNLDVRWLYDVKLFAVVFFFILIFLNIGYIFERIFWY